MFTLGLHLVYTSFGLKQRKTLKVNQVNHVFKHFKKSVKISLRKIYAEKNFLFCGLPCHFWLYFGKNQVNYR